MALDTMLDPAFGHSSRIRGARIDAIKLYVLADALTHHAPDLEFDDPLRGHWDLLKGPGVLCHARSTITHLENPEVPKLQTISVGELLDDGIEKALQNVPYDHLGLARFLGNPVHQLALGDSTKVFVRHMSEA